MNFNSRRSALVASFAVIGLAAGCASAVVSNDAIADRTAFALGLDKSAFTVSNRVDDGAVSRYSVTTKGGRKYNCYVGGTMSMLGRQVSDAICSEAAGGAATLSPPTGAATSAPPCNALLKAAGRCPK